MLSILAGALRDLVLPATCAGCQRPGAALCPSCACVTAPDVGDVAGVPVRAAAAYDGAIRAALIAYKEHGRRDLAVPLGALLAAAVGDRAPTLVPVPCGSASVRRRGGDHVLRLARAAARRSGVATPVQLRRAVLDSAGLGAAERVANLDGAMVAGPPRVPATPVLVVDDIVTSGATIGETVRALRASGWLVTGAAVVAATPRRSTGAALAGLRRSG